MMKIFKRLRREEDGQSLIMVVLLLGVLLSFSALIVDVGLLYAEKSKLQNAADAAALAGAQVLPNKTLAQGFVETYAGSNGVPASDISNISYPGGENKQIKVEVESEVPYIFANFLDVVGTSTIVTASAVAEKKSNWKGESLPFINITFDYSSTDPISWTQVGPGIKGTITDFYTKGSSSDTYFEVDYANGITVKPGFSDGVKGLDESKLKDGLELIITEDDENIKKVYLFSLRSEVIQSEQFTVKDKKNNPKTIYFDDLNKLGEGDVIDPEQLVLIECLFLRVDNYNNKHSMELKYLNNVFDLGNSGLDQDGNPLPDLPDFPTENLHGGGASRLVE